MGKHTNILAITIFLTLLTACTVKKATVSEADMEKQGYVKAMVIHMDLDGCGYMLELSSDKAKLEPDGLQPEFQKDSLNVWIKYKEAPDRMSVCMAGKTIDLIEIKNR